jgi:hypothetical protein
VIEASLFTLLTTDAVIGPQIAAGSGRYRMYPERLPQGAVVPAIVYNVIDSPSEHSQSGPSNLKRPRIQIDCWADDYDAALAFGMDVSHLLYGYKGSVGSSRIDSVLQQNDITMYNEEDRHWRRILDYMIIYAEI